MASMKIIDTGYLRSDIQGTAQATRANSGTAIELRSVDMSFNASGNIDTDPRSNSNSIPVINFGSVNSNNIVINGVLDRTSTTDMNLMTSIRDLIATYGIKLLYYSSITDGYRELTDSLGTANSDDWHKTVFFSGVSTPHLHVRVISFNITQTTTSHLRNTLELMETA